MSTRPQHSHALKINTATSHHTDVRQRTLSVGVILAAVVSLLAIFPPLCGTICAVVQLGGCGAVGFLRAHLVPASFQLSVTSIQLLCPSTRQHVSFFLTLHVLASHNLLAVCRYRLAPVYFTSHKVAGSIGSILCDVDGRVSYIVLPPCIRWVHVPSPLHIDRSRIYPIRSAHPKTVNKYQHADWLMGDFTRIKVTPSAFSTRFVHPSTSQRRYLPMALCASLLDSPQGHTNHDRKRKRYILCCGIKREVMIGKQTICMS